MNFQTLATSSGNMVAMLARVAEIGISKLSLKNKPYQSVKLTDDNNETHSVTIHQGNASLLDANALGQRLAFNLQTYQGQQGIAYSGFWNNKAQVNQQSQPATQQSTAPPQTQQGTQQPAQATKAPQPGVKGEIDIRCFLVCSYIQGGLKLSLEDLEKWKIYIMTGHHPDNLAQPDSSITENQYNYDPQREPLPEDPDPPF